MSYTVYCHIFPNGKKYIGITKQDVKRRWRNGKGYEGQPVYNAILKYGWDNIIHKILYRGLSREEAEEKEIELIKAFNTNSHKDGYNVEKGGNTSEVSEETKKKISEKRKAYFKNNKHWNSGRHLSEETKKKISKAHSGMKYSEDTRKKKSELFRGKNNPMYGTKIPKKHKAKLQEASVKATSRACKCIETGTIYKSIAEASRQTNINSRTIAYVCNKDPRYKTAGGYHWKYERGYS